MVNQLLEGRIQDRRRSEGCIARRWSPKARFADVGRGNICKDAARQREQGGNWRVGQSHVDGGSKETNRDGGGG